MKYYLKDLLPRLKKYSAELDHAAFLVDKPWVVSGEQNEPFQKLIFRRDGRVHLSSNGDLIDGRWEYLPEAKALIIDYGDRKKLYRHEFLDEAVLALKIDGRKTGDDSDYFLLCNEQIVPDANAKMYLRKKLIKENNLSLLLLDSGREIFLKPKEDSSNNEDFLVSDAAGDIEDGIYYFDNGNKRYRVINGITGLPETKKEYPNDITIWQAHSTPEYRDEVIGLLNGTIEFTENSDKHKVFVKDGFVAKHINISEQRRHIISVLFFIAIAIILYFLSIYQNN